MPYQDERLRDIEDRLDHEDPAFAAAMKGGASPAGTPPTPRNARRHGRAWLWLAVGLAALGVGIAIGHGLVIAAGLVVAGAAGQLFDPERHGIDRGQRRGRPETPDGP